MNGPRLLSIATAIAEIAGVPVGPIVGNAKLFASALKHVAGDLEAAPVDAATGQPLTIDAVQHHLDASALKSRMQSDLTRANAQAALDENAAEAHKD